MYYIVAESVGWRVHLETAAEIALKGTLDSSNPTSFVWLGSELPWRLESKIFSLPTNYVDYLINERADRVSSILSSYNINCINPQFYNDAYRILAQNWAHKFYGTLEDLKNYSYGKNDANLGMGVASSLISEHGNSIYDPKRNIQEVRLCLEAACIVYLRAQKTFVEHKPDAIFTFNGRVAIAKPIAVAAEALGIQVYYHERGAVYDLYDIYSEPPHCYSYIRRLINEHWHNMESSTRTRLGHEFFAQKRNGSGIGWVSFTANQVTGHMPEKPHNRKRVVYFSSSDDEYQAVGDLNSRGIWENQLAAVYELIGAAKEIDSIELIIRLHPHLMKKSKEDVTRWNRLEELGVTVIKAHDSVDTYALLDSADMVFSYGSTVGIEAAYWKTPSVLLYDDCVYGNSGAVYVASSREDIHNLLSRCGSINPLPEANCLPYGCYMLSHGIKYKFYEPKSLFEGTLCGQDIPYLVDGMTLPS